MQLKHSTVLGHDGHAVNFSHGGSVEAGSHKHGPILQLFFM